MAIMVTMLFGSDPISESLRRGLLEKQVTTIPKAEMGRAAHA